MKRIINYLIIASIFFCFCTERKRVNQFDVTSYGFSTPPPCYTWGSPVYDPYSGYLVGVIIAVEFTDATLRAFSFEHKFLFNGDDVLNFDYNVDAGSHNYGVQIYYGGEPFPIGDYCLKIYWGEFGYGAFVFSVITKGNATEFKGITKNGTTDVIKNLCYVDLKD